MPTEHLEDLIGTTEFVEAIGSTDQAEYLRWLLAHYSVHTDLEPIATFVFLNMVANRVCHVTADESGAILTASYKAGLRWKEAWLYVPDYKKPTVTWNEDGYEIAPRGRLEHPVSDFVFDVNRISTGVTFEKVNSLFGRQAAVYFSMLAGSSIPVSHAASALIQKGYEIRTWTAHNYRNYIWYLDQDTATGRPGTLVSTPASITTVVMTDYGSFQPWRIGNPAELARQM